MKLACMKKQSETLLPGKKNCSVQNIEGKEIYSKLAERMIGIEVEDLINCKNVVCIAYGQAKAEAIVGALRGGFIDTLIIDTECAEKVVES